MLEAFDERRPGVGISELALRAGLPKSTVSRIVAGLVRQRYLERDGTLIHLGLRLFELGQLAEMPQELRFAALPVMADLRNATGETVHLAIRDGREVVYISIMRGRGSPAPTSRIGGRAPVHATALGKAAARPRARDRDRRTSSVGELGGVHAAHDHRPGVLRRQLDEIRGAGLAAEAGELATGIAGRRARSSHRTARRRGDLGLGAEADGVRAGPLRALALRDRPRGTGRCARLRATRGR